MKLNLPRFKRPKLHPVRPFKRASKTAKKRAKKSWRLTARFTKPIRRQSLVWLFSLSLLVAAQATLIWAPTVGIYVNAVALAGLAIIGLQKTAARKVAISLAIIPLANMVTATVQPKTTIGSAVVFYGIILLLALAYRFMFTLDFPMLHTRLLAKGYGFGIPLMVVIGQMVGLVGFGFLRHHYPYVGYSLPLIALVAVVFAFTEEILLRGLIQQQGERLFHPAAAAVATTVLYVFLVLDHGTILTLPIALLMGGVLSFVYYKKKNLLLTFTLNAAAKLTYIGLVAAFVLRK
ncbi:MAG TPA: CPBP family glutamic-type intramembrane protease [Candidatus Saccharimonadales bacterium]